MRIQIKVDELDCMDEVSLLRGRLEPKAGVQGLDFDVVRGVVTMTLAADGPQPEQVLSWISGLGMTPHLVGPSLPVSQDRSTRAPHGSIHWDWVVGGVFLIVGALLQRLSGESWIEVLAHSGESHPSWSAAACYLVTLLLGLRRIVPRAWAALQQRRADMHVLMCLAAVGAILIQQWLEAAIVTWLFVLALMLESRSVRRARDAIGELLDLAPPVARRLAADSQSWDEVPVEQVLPGEVVQVRPGDRFSLDGCVQSGESDVDQSPITGESQPIAKRAGDTVFAGTINLTGTVLVEVTRPSRDSTVANIVELVRQAQQQRGRAQRWVDRFAEIYTPAMMGLSLMLLVVPPLLGNATWGQALYNSLVVLVIACPCALVISTPVTIVAGLTRGARRGVLIKSGEALERLVRIDAALFDKTGTLTTGSPRIETIRLCQAKSEAELLELAARLESGSSHPVAVAIQKHWQQLESSPPLSAEHLHTQVVPGGGIQTVNHEPRLWIGNETLALKNGVDPSALQAPFGESADDVPTSHRCLWIGTDAALLGCLTLSDTIRSDASMMLVELGQIGVDHREMLTGDARPAAEEVARQLGLDHWQSGMLPQEKATRVQQLQSQGKHVCMVGDGINDSVALAAANVSFAMGHQGADVALQAADIALMGQHLTRIPWSIRHARRALRLVKQNIALALGTKLIFLILAAMGYATLWMAIAADMGTSLVVIANALRILRPLRGEDG